MLMVGNHLHEGHPETMITHTHNKLLSSGWHWLMMVDHGRSPFSANGWRYWWWCAMRSTRTHLLIHLRPSNVTIINHISPLLNHHTASPSHPLTIKFTIKPSLAITQPRSQWALMASHHRVQPEPRCQGRSCRRLWPWPSPRSSTVPCPSWETSRMKRTCDLALAKGVLIINEIY